ncbi:CRYL1 protein, partial [Polypterus senegalus]|nr:CRYL1 protein [Polypterus senegalus]
MVFASGGYRVKIYDIQAGQARRAQEDISKEMRKLQDSGFLRGLLSAEEQTSLISSHDDLKETLESAFFIQECIYENLSAKQEIFCAVESHVADGVILSSSTSCILPTNVFSKVKNRKRCIVSHPVSMHDILATILFVLWHT